MQEKLNERQEEAVRHTEGPLLILAGAGSGKTRVIVHRIAYLVEQKGVPPWNILALTFTNKASNEMRERARAFLGARAEKLWLGTFHATCNRMLRANPWREERLKGFVIYDQTDSISLIKKCLKELNINQELYPPLRIKSMIDRLKDRLVPAEELLRREALTPIEEKMALVYPLYQKRLREAKALDFGDLIMETVRLLQLDSDVLERYQDRFSHIMVDEYQDTNYAQFRLLRLLGEKHRNVCVVGDDDQSIYSWRGANLENILKFEEHYPSARIVKLEENYRSTKTILGAASSLVSRNSGRKSKSLWTRRNDGELITYHVAEDERSEADYIRRMIRKLIESGFGYRDLAVFYRTNAQSRVIEEALRDADIPYQMVGDIQFYQRKEIKDLVAYLKVIVNPSDSVSLRRTINLPPRGIGDKTLKTLEDFCYRESLSLYEGLEKVAEAEILGGGAVHRLREFRAMIDGFILHARSLDPADLLEKIIQGIGYREYLAKADAVSAADRCNNVNEFISSMRQFADSKPQSHLRDFLDHLSLISEQDALDEEMGAVVLMTLHSSKGLEFPVVFMAGMEDGLCPHAMSSGNSGGMEEERRLCYVGMTRAQEKLFLLRARQRTLHGKARCNRPSPFLQDIPGEFLEITKDAPSRGDERPVRRATTIKESLSTSSDENKTPFRKGASVIHPRFGMGIVFKVEGEGAGLKLVVDFKKHGQKKLVARFADLKEV